jgi:hypothetical protein
LCVYNHKDHIRSTFSSLTQGKGERDHEQGKGYLFFHFQLDFDASTVRLGPNEAGVNEFDVFVQTANATQTQRKHFTRLQLHSHPNHHHRTSAAAAHGTTHEQSGSYHPGLQ